MYEALAFLRHARHRSFKDEAQRREVEVLLEMGMYPECAELGEDLLKRMPRDVEVISKAAQARYEMGEYQKAMALLDGMPEKDKPRHARQASMTLHKSGQRDKAYELLEQARQADPENPDNASNKAVMLARDGHMEEAVRLWDEVLRSRPRSADVMYNKGVAFASMGDPQRAQECYRKVLEIDPEHTRAVSALGVLCATDDIDGTLAHFKMAISINLRYALALLYAGSTLSRAGRHRKALKYLEILHNISPGYPGCLYELAAAHAAGGELERASRLAKELFESDPRAIEWIVKDARFERLRV